MKVKEIATHRVFFVEPKSSVDTAIALMEEHDIHHLPVVDHGHVVGMVSDRDLLLAVGWKTASERRLSADGKSVAGPTRIEQIMTAPVISLRPTDTLACAARTMAGRKIGALPLINDGRLVGIISETDVLRLCREGEAGNEIHRRLAKDTVADHMRARVVTVHDDDALTEIVDLFRSKRIRHVPVVTHASEGAEQLIGIVSDRDVRRALGESVINDERAQERGDYFTGPTRVADVMTLGVRTIGPAAPLTEAAEQMLTHHIHALPVISGATLIGILTETDIVRAVAMCEPE